MVHNNNYISCIYITAAINMVTSTKPMFEHDIVVVEDVSVCLLSI